MSWKYYVDPTTPFNWDVMPYFTDVHQDKQTGNIQTISSFYADAKSGHLPQVSWVIAPPPVNDHPPVKVSVA